MTVTSRIPGNYKYTEIIDYLSRRFTYFSRLEWLERVEEGKILLNGKVNLDSHIMLAVGDEVSYEMPEFQDPPADLNYSIIHEDEWIVAVNKPGNLLVHKSGKSFRSNLVYQLRYCHKPATYPGIDAINRLDRETSGIVLLSKDKSCLRIMNEYLAAHGIKKEYIAVAKGISQKKTWIESSPIGRDEKSAVKYRFCVNGIDCKEAETGFEILQSSTTMGISVVRALPITGRTHQIRVHLAAAGLPIAGDKLYGMSEEKFLAWRNNEQSDFSDVDKKGDKIKINRQALHCTSIKFIHPVTKKEVLIEAPLPQDMQELINSL
ncbi:MAG TPA: hypothetical protein DCO75_07880 [Fibrobacteres bacterium]|nr:hypothetical protein [Fibrobacterota bacterium]